MGTEKLSPSQIEQFMTLLGLEADAGLLALATQHPEVLESVAATLRVRLRPYRPEAQYVFSPNDQVLETFLDQNVKQKWGFNYEQIQQLRHTQPEKSTTGYDRVVTLDIRLSDPGSTFYAMRDWQIRYCTPRYPTRADRVDANALLAPGERLAVTWHHPDPFGAAPSVRWVALDLSSTTGTFQNMSLSETSGIAPGTAVMATTLLHPGWFDAINHDGVGPVWVPGFQALMTRDARSDVQEIALFYLHRQLVKAPVGLKDLKTPHLSYLFVRRPTRNGPGVDKGIIPILRNL